MSSSPANLTAWLEARAARRRLPAGAEGRARRLSAQARSGRLRGGVARPADLERRGDPGARHDPDRHPNRPARRSRQAQARYIEAAVNGVLIGCLYLPNGNPRAGPKFDYKLAWFERLHRPCPSLLATGAPVVLAGDYNVVPTEADLYPNHSFAGNALLARKPRGVSAPARPGLDRRPAAPSTDRTAWTFWSYLRFIAGPTTKAAIDHLLLSPGPCRPARGRRCRPLGARPGRSQRPRPAWIVLDR
jgi:hypothetical protein